MQNKAQMKISLGMIFSIFLIVLFIAFAFYGIQKFLGLQETVKTEQFVNNFQSDIDTAWKSSKTSQEKTYSLSRETTEVCFVDDADRIENLILKTENAWQRKTIEHLDIVKIVESGDGEELCFQKVDGKINILIEKDFGENLVTVKRVS